VRCTIGETVLAGGGAHRGAPMAARGGALGSRARGFRAFYRCPTLAKVVRSQPKGMVAAWLGVRWRRKWLGGEGRRGLANGERQPTRCGFARPMGVRRVVMGYWVRRRQCEGWGTDSRKGASASGPRGPTAGARAAWRAGVMRPASRARSPYKIIPSSPVGTVFLLILQLKCTKV
jgi:hypothetical protein